MTLKKFYGDTIKKARETAFDKLGDDCIVLETKDAANGQEACITVMLDKKKLESAGNSSEENKPKKNNATYSRKDLIPSSLNKIKETVTEGFNQISQASGRGLKNTMAQTAIKTEEKESEAAEKDETLTMSRRSTPLYKRDQQQNGRPLDFQQQFGDQMKEAPVSQEVKALHRRFDNMEKLLSDVLISANLEYVSHPAFQQLLNTGIQPTTVTKWFKQVLNKGIDPREQNQSFLYELADIVRSALSFAVPEAPSKHLLFVGPSGSGKTSLIMKLATNPKFMLNKKVALVSIEPKDEFKRYSPLKFFADDENLSFFNVCDGVQMSTFLPDLEEFDHVLFDTPSISLQQKAAFRDFWKIRQILSSVTPLEVHYTVNATLERYYFKEEYAANHPLQPDYMAITHLDETDKWGHLVPFINKMGASVRYVSQGPNVPDNIHKFKAEWFAEKILSTS